MIIRYGLVNPDVVQFRLVRNPAYSGRAVGPFGWRAAPLHPAPFKEKFHAALAESVRQEGLRNPVLLYRFDGELLLAFGGSRVFACRAANRIMPAIINDYDEVSKDCKLVTPDNWTGYFKDVPEYSEFRPEGFDYHYHIEKNRRQAYDPAGMVWADGADWIDEEFPWIKQ